VSPLFFPCQTATLSCLRRRQSQHEENPGVDDLSFALRRFLTLSALLPGQLTRQYSLYK
jgi:hypothetical protein